MCSVKVKSCAPMKGAGNQAFIQQDRHDLRDEGERHLLDLGVSAWHRAMRCDRHRHRSPRVRSALTSRFGLLGPCPARRRRAFIRRAHAGGPTSMGRSSPPDRRLPRGACSPVRSTTTRTSRRGTEPSAMSTVTARSGRRPGEDTGGGVSRSRPLACWSIDCMLRPCEKVARLAATSRRDPSGSSGSCSFLRD